MKVQIIQLEPHDDLASVSDRLAWAQAPRLVLVWPDRGRVLRRRLDLALLSRAAAARGIQIGIVTRDPVALEQAAALGLAVFRSSTRLPEDGWGPTPTPPGSLPARPIPRPTLVAPPRTVSRPLPRGVRAALIAFVAAVLAASLAVLLPSASITLSPARTERTRDLELSLDPRAEAPQAAGIIPARALTRTVSGSIRVTTTGTTRVPSRPAAGMVTFINQTDAPLLIPSGTGVLPSGRPDLRFESTEDVVLEAGRGLTAEAAVVASRPGPSGNLPSGSLNAIEGPLGLKAAVTQPFAVSGGAEIERPAVAAADQANAQRLLTEQLLAQAAADLGAGLAADEELAEASVRVVNTGRRSFDRAVGSAGDSVGLELTLEIAAFAYRPSQLAAAVDLMPAKQPLAGERVVPGSRRVIPSAAGSEHPDKLSVRVEEQTYIPLDLERLRRRIRGLSPAAVRSSLDETEGLVTAPIVTLRPAWWPLLPWLDVRLDLRYEWESR